MLKVIIPAFPRSGTSFLAGLIVRMGLNPGPVDLLVKANEHNPFGYYEYKPLMKISREILRKFGGDFFKDIPDLQPGWTLDPRIAPERLQIAELVRAGNIDVFKDGPMLVIADLYDELFPDARWIVIRRDIHETFKSRFGMPLTFAQWEQMTETRLQAWSRSRPAQKAMTIDYKDFAGDLEGSITDIAGFLGVQLTRMQMENCIDFFRPGMRTGSRQGLNP